MTETISRYLELTAEGGRLHGLRPLPASEVAAIRDRYRGISSEYLEFIERVGVGSCEALNVYPPEPLESVRSHPSFIMYHGQAYRRLLGIRWRKDPPLPRGVVMVADVGASWRYCLSPKRGPRVVVYDMCDVDVMPSHEGFFEFVDDLLSE